jgi:hypothetical protein
LPIIDVTVEDVVQRTRPAAREREPDGHRQEVADWRHAARADEHPADAGQQQQRHDPRLRERDVVAPRAPRHRLAAMGERRHDERCSERRCRRREVNARRRQQRGQAEERDRDERRHDELSVPEPRRDQNRDQRR